MPGCMPLVLGRVPSMAASLRDDGVGMDAALFEHRADDALLLLGQGDAAGASGNITWLSVFSAMLWACCRASWAFWVSLSKRNIGFLQLFSVEPTILRRRR